MWRETMMNKKLLAAIAGLSLLAQPAAGQSRAKPVSIIQLIAVPGKFDGSLVTVQGLLGYDEHPVLWVNEVDAKHWLLANTIRISPSKEMQRDKGTINLKYVTITGVFRAARTGTEAYEGGGISGVQSCTVWSDPQHPISEKERPAGHFK
jgi:hypothetical protein